ncbi:GTPase Era [Candidatus Megaera venefica]|jgi:GTP-binding protein Era|uniref:GTPase Era n=1 Tax=Candidatus Megaera venefica TaxID=2055910 RepID=A0ABU5NCE3_9RICK|nr:GTPase Era [Candidatus Megaera venefica]MEA0970832.1 GTPase Era [Candidatus Megaera venefica]
MKKSLSVCIVGKPNAGKSTLLNQIIGQKLSIVTPKVQTTRSIITGIVTLDDIQLVLFDTPGIFEPKRRLEKAMVRCAWSSLSSADMIVLIIDSSSKLDDIMQEIIKRISSVGKKIVILMNKIDLQSKYYMENMSSASQIAPLAKIFNISALDGNGIDSFLSFLKENATDSGWMYEEDDITNLPARFLASEITREQLFLQLHQELPYNLTVECESWQEQKNGSVKVNQVIIVGRDIHKNMIIGKHGSRIKEIGSIARVNIEELLGIKIHLFLFVKVRENWEDNPELYHNMGLKY